MKTYWIDLFCGAGGTSTGIHLAGVDTEVLACVNHDAEAIKCHKKNHPNTIHFTEDIRDFNVIRKIKTLSEAIRIKEPGAIINIWASLECTHFSKAKGGMARNADSRTLAEHLIRYVKAIDPDYLYIENVREFMSWGPLDKKGKPIHAYKGCDYIKWRDGIVNAGYDYDYRLLNSADFGAYTSRERYFGVFGRTGFPISFPKQTHIKKSKLQNSGLKPWKSVKDLLDLHDEGRSIFGLTKMNRPYSDNTLKRILAGLHKFHKEGLFITSYYGNGGANSVKEPLNTITTKERHAAQFIDYDYSSPTSSDLNAPAGTVTTVPKHKLVSAQWIVDTQFSNNGRSIERPAQTLIAKMDKKPLYLISATPSKQVDNTKILPNDSNTSIEIKNFMKQNKIADIKIRMLHVEELKSIQGFPSDYELTGTKTNQLKFIGNSVVPLMAQKLIESNFNSLFKKPKIVWL
jgi:DNA (cytosine-5)-methyltransferase 1